MWMLKLLFAIFALSCTDSDAKRTIKKQINKINEVKINQSGLNAQYSVLIDYDTGERLFEYNADIPNPPSSMSKLMTLYVLFDEIAAGNVKLDDEFLISEDAQRMHGSRSFFKAGEKARVEDLIRSIVVHSGNDACIIVAEGIAGDVSAFVEKMNEKAKFLGLQNTKFANPTGLPDENHISTVADLAVIAMRIIKDFPDKYHYFAEKELVLNGIKQINRNSLLGKARGVDGLKTGRTDKGGFGIISSAIIDGKRLIAVVNGCMTSKTRAADAQKLLFVGFNDYVKINVAEAERPITFVNVWLGNADCVQLCTHENVIVSMHKKFRNQLVVEAKMIEPIQAPIKAGTKLGTLTYKYGDFVSKPYDLFACETIEKASAIERAKTTLKYLLFGGYGSEGDKDNKTTKPINFLNSKKGND